MNSVRAGKITRMILIVIAVTACLYGVWAYIFSFQTVTFTFDDKLGYIEIENSSKQKLYPKNNQVARLKKGEYTAKNIGKNITKDTRKITIASGIQSVETSFSYTEKYLEKLYAAEKETIYKVLLREYPEISKLYVIRTDRLYARGNVFGATLIAKDQNSDNADTLRVVMQKKSDRWEVQSKPPTPILSAAEYPDIPRDVLLKINN